VALNHLPDGIVHYGYIGWSATDFQIVSAGPIRKNKRATLPPMFYMRVGKAVTRRKVLVDDWLAQKTIQQPTGCGSARVYILTIIFAQKVINYGFQIGSVVFIAHKSNP
jgi:hypothetical protein